jgi:ABC-type transport system involved in cytochrome c biogenesis permease subunit
LAAWILYTLSFFFYVIALTGTKWSNREPAQHAKRWSRIAFTAAVLGVISHFIFFATRWISSGHIPVSNMFEFMTFLSMMIMVAFTVIYLIFRAPILGVFSMPVGFIILAYAAVFPRDIQPLIPALKSYWLYIHVTTAAAGEAFFAVGFAAGLMYLLRTVKFKSMEIKDRKAQRGVEFTLFVIVIVIAFITVIFGFRGAGYEAQFSKEQNVLDEQGNEYVVTKTVQYTLPPLIQPYDTRVDHMDPFIGLTSPLIVEPSWMEGINAKKLNTVIWSIISGFILYGLLRLILRKTLGSAVSPIMDGIDPEDLDEISYRAIAIGFPIFTLGALIFAMLWAYEAWGRFWGWDPKEVWALITWLFYVVYLHLRLSRGWLGGKSAWLSVIGFLVVMFTLIGVNLIIAGLHAYAGEGL